MVAPTPASVTQTHFPALTSNPVIDLDDATAAGDRSVVFVFLGRSRPLGVTWPSPWVEPVDINNTNGNTMITTVGWLDHAGPATSVQLTTVSTHAVWAQAFRFAAGTFDPATPPEFATAINSGNPPLLNPSWGVEEWLAFATLTRDGGLGTVTFPLPNNQLSTNGGIFGSAALCTGPITADSFDPAEWVVTTVGAVVTAGLRGPVGAAPEPAELALTLPALTIEAEGTATTAGEVTAVLPALSASVEGEAAASGAVAAVLPALGAALEGEAGGTGQVDATLPALAVELTGSTETATGTLDAVLPALTFVASGAASADGALAAALPPLAVAVEAGAAGAGVFDAGLPPLVVGLQGVVEAPPTGELTATLPPLAVEFAAGSSVDAALAASLPALSMGAVGHAGDMIVPLCEPWPLPASCAAPTGTPEALQAASEDLWELSGHQFGSCVVTLRPCRKECTPNGWRPRSWWDGGGWPTLRSSALWWDAVCGRCRTGCSCNDADTLMLPEDAQSIVEIIVDGVVLPASAYVLYDGHKLVRADGERWPLCQDWTVPVSGVGAWSVTAIVGRPVPAAGGFAAAELAAQYAAWCTGGACALPAGVTGVARQGVTQTFPSIVELRENGLTGLPMVDRFLDIYNPARLTDRPRTYNPDDWTSTARTLTQGTS